MEVIRPSVGRYYRPELDVIRFLAFLLVFLSHTLPRSQDLPRITHSLKYFASVLDAFDGACRFGLSLFFTLSAFLICEVLLRERESAGVVSIKQFYIRRILRIWPLYYLALALCLVVAFLPGGPRGDVIRVSWFAVFLGSWYSAFHGSPLTPLAPLWSISVEEQFYLVVPWAIKYIDRMLLYWFCAGIILVSNVTLYYLGSVSAPDPRIWFDSFVQFECFAAGIWLCIFLRGRLPRIAAWQRLMLIASGWFCWVIAYYGQSHRFQAFKNPGSWQLIGGYAFAAIGSVLLLVAFLGLDRKLLPGWAIYLGRISFGLYVYHEFAIYITSHFLFRQASLIASPILLLKIGVELGLTVLMAALSYRYFETPFLKMKKRHTIIESQPVSNDRSGRTR